MIIKQTNSNIQDWSDWFTNNFIVYIGTVQTSRDVIGGVDKWDSEEGYTIRAYEIPEYTTFVYNDEVEP